MPEMADPCSPRPTKRRFPASRPLITGQRILIPCPDRKRRRATVPGGFGTGKTMTPNRQVVRCGYHHPHLYRLRRAWERDDTGTRRVRGTGENAKTGHPLMNRSMIANTSNMPVAAREASIYTGLTLAEYYRDMGYNVAIMADSTSRWAEALRELSGRLEEMPAEEGFPAYLASRCFCLL